MLEDAVRRWTAAYIAHAKEKHAEGWRQCSGCLSLRGGVVHFFYRDAPLAGRVRPRPYFTSCNSCEVSLSRPE
jgi:hypothetical protein